MFREDLNEMENWLRFERWMSEGKWNFGYQKNVELSWTCEIIENLKFGKYRLWNVGKIMKKDFVGFWWILRFKDLSFRDSAAI